MKITSLCLAFLTVFGAFTPVVAQAAPCFTPHAKIVQEINHAYGTRFKVPCQIPTRSNAPLD